MAKMKSDKEYQAEWDAQTLADAKQIESDKTRMNAAAKAANTMAIEAQKRAQALQKIKKPTTKKPAVKKTVTKKTAVRKKK